MGNPEPNPVFRKQTKVQEQKIKRERKLAISFLWTSGNLFHVAWQGNFESWVQDPLHVRPIAHAIWDPHFGQPAVETFTRGVGYTYNRNGNQVFHGSKMPDLISIIICQDSLA
ncbi:hypothetical protein RJ639_044524 [Escallonia herrerae]|uniref:Uncharacterized protein n=1 Tax=Escallonia herrerae TaxID=1293975 RepID=A0AA88WBP0_9ASTE|nr:hypothetical protein RJ639_044524 [Escallonia herrerae]